MPKKEVGKNSKSTKKNTTKSTVKKVEAKKVVKTTAKKETVKPVVKEDVTKVVTKETVKPVVKKEKKGNGKVKVLFDKITNNAPFAVALCVILVLVAALILTLCIKRVPKVKNGNEVIASVKGKTITAQDLYESLKDSYGTDSVINLIDTYIAEKEVKITKEDKDYVKQVVDYYKNYADYYKTDLATFLANYVGLSNITTEEEFSEYVLADYKKTLAVQKFIGDNASEKDLKDYYKNNYSDTLTAKHILIEVDKDAKDQDKADKEAYNKAVKLIQTLNKTDKKDLDKKFDELAKNNSDDTETYSNGGLIKDFTKSTVEEAFWNASYKLKDGEVTATPVKTSYGYHVILKVSSTPVKAYKKIKDEVKTAYAKNLLSSDTTLQVKKWDELRKQYKLSINDDFVKKAYKEKVKNGSKKVDTTQDTSNTSNTSETEGTEKTEE